MSRTTPNPSLAVLALTIALSLASAATAQTYLAFVHSSFFRPTGNPSGCLCYCPPGQGGCPCAWRSVPGCVESSGNVNNMGVVNMRACVELTQLKALASVAGEVNAHAQAAVTDRLTLRGGTGQALVRATWSVRGARTGETEDGQLRYRLRNTIRDISPVPVQNEDTLQTTVSFGDRFTLQSSLTIDGSTACGQGGSGTADYFSGDFGVTLVGVEVFTTTGQPLRGVSITGDSGFLYVCGAELSGDGVVDAVDFFLYLEYFDDDDPRADFTGPGADGIPDGILDANDFFFYLQLFADGCP